MVSRDAKGSLKSEPAVAWGGLISLLSAVVARGRILVSSVNRKDVKKPMKKRRDAESANRDIGRALRTVYEKAVEEDVPQEMLDLLGKLK